MLNFRAQTEQQSPTRDAGKVAPAQTSQEGSTWKDKNKLGGVSVQKVEVGSPAWPKI